MHAFHIKRNSPPNLLRWQILPNTAIEKRSHAFYRTRKRDGIEIVRTASFGDPSFKIKSCFVFEPYLLDIVLCMMYVCTTERKRWRGGVMGLAAYLTQAFLRDFFGCCFRCHAHALMIRRSGYCSWTTIRSNQSCCNERGWVRVDAKSVCPIMVHRAKHGRNGLDWMTRGVAV
jgi:hypothetical protein